MPTLIRFLTVVLVLAALAAAATVYLAYMVPPNTREMTIRIPASKLAPQAEPLPQTGSVAPAAADPAEDAQ